MGALFVVLAIAFPHKLFTNWGILIGPIAWIGSAILTLLEAFALALGLSYAFEILDVLSRRDGPLPPPPAGSASSSTKSSGKQSSRRQKTSRKRSQATLKALKREGRSGASRKALSKQARSTAGKRRVARVSSSKRKAA